MPPRFGIEYTSRKCLGSCGKMFPSSGKGNRICPSCAALNRKKSTPPPRIVSRTIDYKRFGAI